MKKRVLTFGVFDFFHLGHLKLFENIRKRFGEDTYLIVAVQKDEAILKYKPNAEMFYTTDERIRLLEALKVVDEVVTYQNVGEDIQKIDFDVFVKGEDQIHKGFEKATRFAEENHKEIFILPRTAGVSSSKLKTKISNLE